MSELTDERFFTVHRDRYARIRLPRLELIKDRQRNVGYVYECTAEFNSLGPHNKDRRRILIYRVPKENPLFDAKKQQLLKIPFLLFADETVEDRDDVLLPIIDRLMREAALR